MTKEKITRNKIHVLACLKNINKTIKILQIRRKQMINWLKEKE